jgi:peptidoglycan/LPS O-acetylase OafA/YrhL
MVGAYALGLPLLDWGQDPSSLQFYVLLSLTTPMALCFSVGMLFLDFTNKVLRYGQEAALPFFVLHQPVIIVIAFFIVQWNAGIWIKLPIVLLGSFLVTITLYELVVRRIRLFRLLFGIKVQGPKKQQTGSRI